MSVPSEKYPIILMWSQEGTIIAVDGLIVMWFAVKYLWNYYDDNINDSTCTKIIVKERYIFTIVCLARRVTNDFGHA